MALNEVYAEAFSLNYGLPANARSGDFVVVTDGLTVSATPLCGVAETDSKPGNDGLNYVTLRHIGVFIGQSEEAFAVGQDVYLETLTSSNNLVSSATGLVNVGKAVKAKAAGAGDVHVRINN